MYYTLFFFICQGVLGIRLNKFQSGVDKVCKVCYTDDTLNEVDTQINIHDDLDGKRSGGSAEKRRHGS